MTDCPTDELGVTICARQLIDAAAKHGAIIHIDTRSPDGPPDPLDPNPAVTYICPHANRYWVTAIKES